MKNISIAFSAWALTIPIGYHHQVQGLIYKLLRDGGRENIHDKSIDFGRRQYKLFTFSSLRGGKVSADRKSLRFDSTAYLDVRSVRTEFCEALLKGIQSAKPLQLFGQPISVSSVKTSDAPITSSCLRIKMLSPLTVHRTHENGYTEYLNPLDADFAEEINTNFARKYYAFYGEKPPSQISIRAESVGARDKYLTLFKKADEASVRDLYISGWRGEYELRGSPKHLTFLYYCGLGARNSSGFGMFEPV